MVFGGGSGFVFLGFRSLRVGALLKLGFRGVLKVFRASVFLGVLGFWFFRVQGSSGLESSGFGFF